MTKNAIDRHPASSADWQEAKRYWRNANDEELAGFAARQLAARRRVTRLKRFYAAHDCRPARLHMLAACAIALGRFCGVSATFGAIGEALMPVDDAGAPRTEEWRAYAAACRRNRPVEVRDELWLAAHFADLERVRAQRLEEEFYAEADRHAADPLWLLLRQHLEVTLGVRLMDRSALAGLIPHETAMADSLALTVKKLSTAGLRLVGRYAMEAARATFDCSGRDGGDGDEILSYRRTTFEMARAFGGSLRVAKIFRRGLRERERGRRADAESWQLLETVLGDRAAEVAPLIREFYANPSRFDVTATLRLETLPAKFWSRALTLLFGQGLFETNLEEIPARFRIFARRDGSMHFIRELYCDGRYRVFDSDFVVRAGALYEVFTDLGAAVELEVAPAAGGGLVIGSRRILWRGRRLPSLGLTVRFQSRAEGETLHIDGQLLMSPRTPFGRFFAYQILRRPENLGSIHYRARRREREGERERGRKGEREIEVLKSTGASNPC